MNAKIDITEYKLLNSRTRNSGWIWTPEWEEADEKVPRLILFRKPVRISATPDEGRLLISADTKYKLYVNGNCAAAGPSRGDSKVWYYDSVDILPFLNKGENVIAVEVLRYPMEPGSGNHGMMRTAMPGLFISGYVKDVSSENTDIHSDVSWKCLNSRLVEFYHEDERFSPLVIHEHAKGSAAIHGWKEPFYDDDAWLGSAVYDESLVPQVLRPQNLYPRNIPFMEQKPERSFHNACIRKKMRIPAGTSVSVELDAGEEMTGYISLFVSGGRGAGIRLLYSEAYVQDGFTDQGGIPIKGDRLDREHGHLYGYEDTYLVSGHGTPENPEVYEPFWFRTFRFIGLTVETADEDIIIRDLTYRETGYPLEIKTSVHTSDPTLDGIWDISVRTLRRCMHETYEDCPFYEQLQYIMDARLEALYTYSVSADDRLARKCMDDLRRSQHPDGLLNCSYPNCREHVIPGFSIYYILMVYDHMMYFGDKDFAMGHMETVGRILDFFESHVIEEGYVGKIGGAESEGGYWSFIDWAEGWNCTGGMPPVGLKGPVTMETLLYIYGLIHAAELSDMLGKDADARRYRRLAENRREAVRRCCMDDEGVILDGPGGDDYSQHCQVFAVLTDTVDMETGRRNLVRTFEDPKFEKCTVAMSFYLFRALEKAGLYEYTDRCWDTWRKMIENHCTTCVEAESYARSECHGWGALILYELPSVTLGVRPAVPGYKKIRIAPVPGYLTYAGGTVHTPAGDVKVSWRLIDGHPVMEYEAPPEIEVVL